MNLDGSNRLYLENWIKYQIVYKQVNNENEIEKFKTTEVFLKLIEGNEITISKLICTEKTRRNNSLRVI